MPIYPLGGWGQQRTVGGTGSTNVDQIARNAAANALAAAMAAQTEADANEAKLTTIESGATADQTPDEIRDSLQTLSGTDRLDASAVRNIPAGTTLVIHDPTLTGEGNTGDPLTVTTPFTSAEEAKLGGIENLATADQDAAEIRDELETLMGDDRLEGTSVKDSVDQIARTEAQTAQTDAATASQEATAAQTTADTNLGKLNTIESGATQDQTAEEIRDLIQTLTGIDRLDGNSIRDIIDVTARSIAATARATATANATKLAGIEDHATADQTDAEIRDALQALMGMERLDASAIQNLPVNTFTLLDVLNAVVAGTNIASVDIDTTAMTLTINATDQIASIMQDGVLQSATFNASTKMATFALSNGGSIDVDFSTLASIQNPAFQGIPTAPTAATSANTTQLATCAFVVATLTAAGYQTASQVGLLITAAVTDLIGTAGGARNTLGELSDAIDLRATIESPTLTGTPTSPTPPTADSSTRVATTALVQAAVAAALLTGGADGVLMTASITGTMLNLELSTGTVLSVDLNVLLAGVVTGVTAGQGLSSTETMGNVAIQVADGTLTLAMMAQSSRWFRGAWATGNSYAIGQVVTHAGHVWTALQPQAIDHEPGTTGQATYWHDFSETYATVAALNVISAEVTHNEQQILLRAPSASPSLTGIPTSITTAISDNSAKIATTAFTQSAIANALLTGGADGVLMSASLSGTTLSLTLSTSDVIMVDLTMLVSGLVSSVTSGSGITVVDNSGAVTVSIANGAISLNMLNLAAKWYRGAWQIGQTYFVGQITDHNSKVWISLQNTSTDFEPGSVGHESYWHDLTEQYGLKAVVDANTAAIALRAPLADPVFSGAPTAPTPQHTDNSQRIATTAYVLAALVAAGYITTTDAHAYVNGAIATLIGSAPAGRNTLGELSAAIDAVPTAGFTLRFGPAAPLNSLGDNGDWYIATTNGGFYEKNTSGAWQLRYTDQAGGGGGLTQAQVEAIVAASALIQANNLSDILDAAVARTNLGLGTAAVLDAGAGGGDVPVLDISGLLSPTVIAPIGTAGQILTRTLNGQEWQTGTGGGGIAVVAHDSTLAGEGTATTPLMIPVEAITEALLDISNTAADGLVLSYSSGRLRWITQSGGQALPTHSGQILSIAATTTQTTFAEADFTGALALAFSDVSHTVVAPAYTGFRHFAIARLATDPDLVFMDIGNSGLNQIGAMTKEIAPLTIGTDQYGVWVSNQILNLAGYTVEAR